MMIGPMAIKLGRKPCLWTACLLCAASDAIMMGTTKLAGLYVGRLFIGIANGFFMTFSQLYLQEVAPARYRGMALAMFQIWTSIGSLVGTIVDNFTSKIMSRASYMIPLSLIYIVPAFIAFGLFLIPESPRYLVYRGNVEQARKSLHWLRPNKDAIEAELAEMQIAINAEKEHVQGAPWVDMWRNPVDRRRTLLSIGAIGVQAACGVMFMLGKSKSLRTKCLLTVSSLRHVFLRDGECWPPIRELRHSHRYWCHRHHHHDASYIVLWSPPNLLDIRSRLLCLLPTHHRRCLHQKPRDHIDRQNNCRLLHSLRLYLQRESYTSSPDPDERRAVTDTLIQSCICPYSWLLGGELPSQRLRSYTFGMATGISFLGAVRSPFLLYLHSRSMY